MLHKVHGCPQLHLPQAKDVGPRRGHHRGTSFHCTYDCEVECCNHGTTIIASRELAAIRKDVAEEAPNAKKSTGSFESAEGSKEVLIDPSDSKGKTVCIVAYSLGFPPFLTASSKG